MDILSDNSTLTVWLLEYGSVALFLLLAFGIIALPIPEETLMVISGILMFHEKLRIIPTLLAAYFGVMCGISVSYLLGRTANHYLIPKYGKWIGITHERVNKAHSWFEHFGKWTLSFGYFIPGVRHFTGFVAGSANLEYRQFALFAYSGALLWVSMFLSIGYFFGNHWIALFDYYRQVEIGFDWLTIAIAIGIILLIFYAIYRTRRS